jgi:hypothetical protein
LTSVSHAANTALKSRQARSGNGDGTGDFVQGACPHWAIRSVLDRVQPPFAGDALELVLATVIER